MLGLEGEAPESIDPNIIPTKLAQIREAGKLSLLGLREIELEEKKHLIFHWRQTLSYRSNGMRFTAYDDNGKEIYSKVYYSVGGGFVVNEEAANADRIKEDDTRLPYPFKSAAELLGLCQQYDLSISQLMLENEKTWRSEQEIRDGLWKIWEVMQECVHNGCQHESVLPGGMKVKRRAVELYRKLSSKPDDDLVLHDHLIVTDWVNLYALAVNEENAAGGRVVTAPTSGAAGILPAMMHSY